jgi:hypothetical protein
MKMQGCGGCKDEFSGLENLKIGCATHESFFLTVLLDRLVSVWDAFSFGARGILKKWIQKILKVYI